MSRKLQLNGNPREQDMQWLILNSLGAQEYEPRVDKTTGKAKWVRTGVWLGQRSMFWRANSGLFWSKDGQRPIRANVQGCADILGVVCGVSVHLEVKRVGRAGKLEPQTPEQYRWMLWVRNAGGVYEVVGSPAEAQAVVRRIRGGAA